MTGSTAYPSKEVGERVVEALHHEHGSHQIRADRRDFEEIVHCLLLCSYLWDGARELKK